MNGYVLPSIDIVLFLVLLVQTSQRAVKYHSLNMRAMLVLYNSIPIVCVCGVVWHLWQMSKISLGYPMIEGFYALEAILCGLLLFITKHLAVYKDCDHV